MHRHKWQAIGWIVKFYDSSYLNEKVKTTYVSLACDCGKTKRRAVFDGEVTEEIRQAYLRVAYPD